MEIIGCGRGHFYNPSEYSSCPQCARENGGAKMDFVAPLGPTEPVNSSGAGHIMDSIGSTEPIGSGSGFGDFQGKPMSTSGFGDYQGTPMSTSAFEAASSDIQEYGPTVPVSPTFSSTDSRKTPFSPVVGWLVCIEGPAIGVDYRIHSQYNYIGRGRHMDICISGDNCISTEKAAIIAYDDEEKTFSFGPGLGHNVVRVNGKMLMNATPLKAYDELTVGKTKLLFVPLCGERFDWNGK